MAFTGTATENLGLPQWNPQDHPSFLTDINDAWKAIDENAGRVKEEMEGVPEQLEQLQALTQSLNEDVSQNTAGLQNLEVRIGNVEANAAKVPGMQEQIEAAQRNIAENSSDIAAAQRDIASAETSIAANTTKITALEGSVESARVTIAENTTKITEVESSVETAEALIEANTTKITEAEGDITTINTKVTNAEKNISSNSNKITSANNKISQVEVRLGNMNDVWMSSNVTFRDPNGNEMTPIIRRLGQLITLENIGRIRTRGRDVITYTTDNNGTQQINNALNVDSDFVMYTLAESSIISADTVVGYVSISKSRGGNWSITAEVISGEGISTSNYRGLAISFSPL